MKNNIYLTVIVILFFLLISACNQAPPPQSKLSIICNKSGAGVFIDGNHMGECPMEVVVSAGEHTLNIKTEPLDGEYFEFQKTYNIGAGVTQIVEATLKSNLGEGYYEGKDIYFKGKGDVPACNSCHGDDALGNDVMGGIPRLAGLSPEYLKRQMDDYAHDKRMDKTTFIMNTNQKGLTAKQREAVASYVSRIMISVKIFNQEQLKELGVEMNGSPDSGRVIFEGSGHKSFACNKCHSPDDQSKGPRIHSQRYTYLVNQLKQYRNGIRTNNTNPDMLEAKNSLSYHDIDSVAQYLAGYQK